LFRFKRQKAEKFEKAAEAGFPFVIRYMSRPQKLTELKKGYACQ